DGAHGPHLGAAGDQHAVQRDDEPAGGDGGAGARGRPDGGRRRAREREHAAPGGGGAGGGRRDVPRGVGGGDRGGVAAGAGDGRCGGGGFDAGCRDRRGGGAAVCAGACCFFEELNHRGTEAQRSWWEPSTGVAGVLHRSWMWHPAERKLRRYLDERVAGVLHRSWMRHPAERKLRRYLDERVAGVLHRSWMRHPAELKLRRYLEERVAGVLHRSWMRHPAELKLRRYLDERVAGVLHRSWMRHPAELKLRRYLDYCPRYGPPAECRRLCRDTRLCNRGAMTEAARTAREKANAGGVIEAVRAGSVAERLGLRAGDRIVAVDGRVIRDAVDVRFATAEERVALEVVRDGTASVLAVEKHPDEDLGVEFREATFDGIRICNNACFFCFLKGNPKGMRKTLYVKDDDYRLSFVHGNFVTLTNLDEDDWARLAEQRLSPINVSVHATDVALRQI